MEHYVPLARKYRPTRFPDVIGQQVADPEPEREPIEQMQARVRARTKAIETAMCAAALRAHAAGLGPEQTKAWMLDAYEEAKNAHR